MQELRINTEFLGQIDRSHSQDLNVGLAQYTASVRPAKHLINSETQYTPRNVERFGIKMKQIIRILKEEFNFDPTTPDF